MGILTRSALLAVSFLTGALAGRGVPGPAAGHHVELMTRGTSELPLVSGPEMEVSFDFPLHPMSSTDLPFL